MPKRKVTLLDALSVRLAMSKRNRKSSSAFQNKRTMTLLLGAVMSVGGISQGLGQVQFLVEKDLDTVKVVRRNAGGEKVVADVGDSFAANSLYKLAGLAPGSFLSRKSSVLDAGWLARPEETWLTRSAAGAKKLGTEITDLDSSLREEFFRKGVPYGSIIHEKAEKYDVDPALVAAVVEAESKFRHRARSQVGAQGLMQLMPKTGRWMGAKNLYDPTQNVDAGAKYLKYLQERFDGNMTKTIAAYNAGEGSVRRYNGVPPYRETRTYVRRVMSNYNKRQSELENFASRVAQDEAPAKIASR